MKKLIVILMLAISVNADGLYTNIGGGADVYQDFATGTSTTITPVGDGFITVGPM